MFFFFVLIVYRKPGLLSKKIKLYIRVPTQQGSLFSPKFCAFVLLSNVYKDVWRNLHFSELADIQKIVKMLSGQFPDWTFHRLILLRGQILDWHFPNGHFPDGHFPEWTIPQPDTSRLRHFLDRTFPRPYILVRYIFKKFVSNPLLFLCTSIS